MAYSALIEEYNIVKMRLEAFDPVFRFENQVFTSIARSLQHARVSPKQAFDEFDKDGSGTFNNSEFKRVLSALKLNLSPKEEQVVWQALDVDRSGTVDFGEFQRKLEHYGVRNQSREEFIFQQVVLAMKDTSIGTPDRLF